MTKLDEARAFADDFLFPTANVVDAMDVLPRERPDRRAARGRPGLASRARGRQMADAWPIVAAFAGGCLTTTLVWLQHHGNLAACAFGPEHVGHWAEPMASGDVRSSV